MLSKLLVLKLLLLFALNSTGQVKHEITYGDTLYMKCWPQWSCELKDSLDDGEWVVYALDWKKVRKPWKPKDLYHNSKYRGPVAIVATYKNRVRNGIYSEYDPFGNEMLKVDVSFKNGIVDGMYLAWYRDSTKQEQGLYENGLREGIWTSWYLNQQKMSEEHYFEGVLQEWTKWYENGQKSAEGYGDYCERKGKVNEWYPNGKLKAEWAFELGQPQAWKLYYENGQLKQEGFGGEYNQDVTNFISRGKCLSGGYETPKNGKWKYYNESGKLIREETYQDGDLIESKEF